jgi:hypothetical protein
MAAEQLRGPATHLQGAKFLRVVSWASVAAIGAVTHNFDLRINAWRG